MHVPADRSASPDSEAPYYDTYWSKEGFNPGRALPPSVAAILERLMGDGIKCLDVGCGDGRTEGLWLNTRCSYVGVDVSRTAVSTARSFGLDAQLIDEASDLPFADDAFDLIVCFEVLEHLDATVRAANEMRRVLKPGGCLVVTVPNVAYWQRRAELCLGIWNPYGDDRSIAEPWRDPHIRFFTATALRDLLTESGLRVLTVAGHEGTAYSSTVPGLRRIRGLGRIEALYLCWQRRWPALFAARLHAIAVKPLTM